MISPALVQLTPPLSTHINHRLRVSSPRSRESIYRRIRSVHSNGSRSIARRDRRLDSERSHLRRRKLEQTDQLRAGECVDAMACCYVDAPDRPMLRQLSGVAEQYRKQEFHGIIRGEKRARISRPVVVEGQGFLTTHILVRCFTECFPLRPHRPLQTFIAIGGDNMCATRWVPSVIYY